MYVFTPYMYIHYVCMYIICVCTLYMYVHYICTHKIFRCLMTEFFIRNLWIRILPGLYRILCAKVIIPV